MVGVSLCGLVIHLIAVTTSHPAGSRAASPTGGAARVLPFTPDEPSGQPMPTADELVRRYATPVPGTEGTQPTITGMWCSDESLLCFGAPQKYPGPLQAWRLNTRTGLRTPLLGLTRRLEATRGPEIGFTGRWSCACPRMENGFYGPARSLDSRAGLRRRSTAAGR